MEVYMKKKVFWIIAFLYCNSLNTGFASDKISLPFLDCSKDAVIGSNVGIRPYRTGGMRLEKQSLADKVIFHNYGHGGAGATLAPGCVQHIVSLFEQEEPERKSVSIIGSGFMGLLTAHQLLDKGYTVTLYSKQFPEKEYFYQENKSCITSLAGGGYWLPFGIDKGNDAVLFKSLQRTSFEYYKESTQRSKGISFRSAYYFPSRGPDPLPEELGTPTKVEVEFGNQCYFQADTWSTIHIDNPIFIGDLYTSAKERGAKFQMKDFATTEDVLALTDTYVFNCTGYGSKSLFNDSDLKPIRGQLVYLKPQPSFDFFLFGRGKFGSLFGVYPSADKVSVGFTYEEGEEELKVNPKSLKEMRENIASFFEDKIR
jgi:D-amino-acid oxidase